MGFDKFLVLSLVLGFAAAQTNENSSEIHIEEYIAANKRQYAETVKVCDSRLESFKELYAGRVNTIDTQMDFLISSVEQANERLTSVELLSEVTKECSSKYKVALPQVANVRELLQNCSRTALSELESLLAPAQETRNKLATYFDETLNKEISNCPSFTTDALNNTDCVRDIISAANAFTVSNQKAFDYQMNTAACSANTYVKMALDCSFVVQGRTITLITATNLLIDRCSKNEDCVSCDSTVQCENVREIPADAIEYNNPTMVNPFYDSKEPISCILIRAV